MGGVPVNGSYDALIFLHLEYALFKGRVNEKNIKLFYNKKDRE